MENQVQNHWYNKTWLVIILCLVFFPVGLYALWKSQVISKGVKIGVTIVIGLVFILSLGDKSSKDSPENTQELAEPTQEDQNQTEAEKKWVDVYTFKGNGMKKSPLFELTGSEARLKYKYSGDDDMGLFSVYVVDGGKDIMEDGGIPEVMIQVSEDSESSIQKSAGTYYLNVNAVGKWEVTVQEFK